MLKHTVTDRKGSCHAQPPLGGCVLKPEKHKEKTVKERQPPLGGCVLKRGFRASGCEVGTQPPLGGCVLKLLHSFCSVPLGIQPPLGGCVLKLRELSEQNGQPMSAASRRLCVETSARC